MIGKINGFNIKNVAFSSNYHNQDNSKEEYSSYNNDGYIRLVCENLDLAYQNLNTGVQNSSKATDVQKETISAIVENKKILPAP